MGQCSPVMYLSVTPSFALQDLRYELVYQLVRLLTTQLSLAVISDTHVQVRKHTVQVERSSTTGRWYAKYR